MEDKTLGAGIVKNIKSLITLLISMAGFVPKNASVARTILMSCSLTVALCFSHFQPANSGIAFLYFFISETLYLGFITLVLSENGLRYWFIKRWGNEEDGYIAYETILGFLFFENAIGIGYVASSTPGNLFSFIHEDLLLTLAGVMFIGGFVIKILAAKAVSIEIYYWKDMFLGRKICDFVVTGPYKYFNNPMYGIGQIQAYATAIWYGSVFGLSVAFLNQLLIFSFYFLIEKKFIQRVYEGNIAPKISN
jgi:protein-S-isoprenylcysteine O-methyltransferase Ste14